MHIVVQSITPVNDQGNLKAFVNVTVDGTTWNRCRIVQQPGQRAWLSLPQLSWTDPSTGEPIYRPAMTAPKETKEEVSKAVLAAWAAQGGSI